MLSEYPEGYDPSQQNKEEQKKDEGPLEDRLQHKLFKIRANAFEELAKVLLQENAS